MMKKEYFPPKIETIYLDGCVVLSQATETTPDIPPGSIGMVPDGFASFSSKDIT